MQVTEIAISEIKVKDRYREDMGDLESLATAIQEKGLIQPITVSHDMKLIAGGRRLAACSQLGWIKIPAIVRKTTGKVDSLELELMENAARKDMTWPELCRLEKRIWDLKSEQGKWNQAKQAEVLNQSPMQTSRRLQMAEAMELLPDLGERQTFDEAWKELKKLEENTTVKLLESKVAQSPAIVQAKQFADDHYIVGDALSSMALCDSDSADFAEVDPPYAVDLDARKSRNKDKGYMGAYNELDTDEYMPFITEVANQVFRILRPNSFAVFWYGMSWHTETLSVLRKAGFGVPDIPAIWYKHDSGQTASPDTTFASCYEPFFLCRKGKPKMPKAGRSNVFHVSPVPPSRKIHPTQKPLALLDEIFATLVWPGSNVLIPFLGSGVTLQAAYKNRHTGWGWDLDETNKERFLRMIRGDFEVEGEAYAN